MKIKSICQLGFHYLFSICQRFGFHITRNHFYHPIPDTRKLNENVWSDQNMIGLNINEEILFDFVSKFLKFKKEYDKFPRSNKTSPHQYFVNNGSFQGVDGDVYYCMIRLFKPKRIIEIGSGFSTFLAAQALLKNEEEYGVKCELISIEPYPNSTLKKGFPGLSKLIESKVEDLDLSFFQILQENDILFIDSSHVLKIGSDVQYEYLKLIPSINKGVLVHIHDIFLPSDYSKEWVLKYHRFWNEQYILQAFLSFNNNFEILWPGNYMNLNHPDKLSEAFSSYNEKRTPKSFWIRRNFK